MFHPIKIFIKVFRIYAYMFIIGCDCELYFPVSRLLFLANYIYFLKI